MNRTRWHVFAREYVVSLFPVSHLVDCLGFSIKRVLGQNAGEFGCKLEDHAVWWLVTDGWGSLHRRLVRRIERNPKWFPLMLRRIEQHGRGLVETARHLGGGDLTKLSSSELNRRYLKFREHNLRLYDIALLCSLLDYQSDTYLSDAVNAVLVPRVAKERVAQYFTTLTTPLRRSLDQVQEEHLLGLYAELRRFPTLLKALSSVTRSNFLDLVRKRDPKWHKHFLSHVKNFAAWPYVYEGPAADEDYFIELLRDFRRRRVNPQATLRRRQLQLKELADRHRQYLKELRLSAVERNFIRLAQDTTFVKPLRRLLQSRAYYYFEPVLSEIAARLGLSLRQVRYLLSEEMDQALRRGYTDVNALNQRIKRCVYTNSNGKVKLLVGKDADIFWRTVQEEKIPRHVAELSGTTACVGRASGRVCIVNTPEDMARMKPGNILVSFATSPNLMPAIRQAAAIVTDEGGLTSHAAIVSRELRIPCVIGTRIATKVLKEGERVIVDASAAIVKRA